MENEIRKGGWIQTYTGKMFYPLDPRPEDICIQDITHALSNLCRFTGHCISFYSVLQHSVLVSDHSLPEFKFHSLLHDASEAYLQDIATPLKRLPEFAAYREAEDRLQRMIFKKFGLSEEMPPEVIEVDKRMLATEMIQLMGKPPQPWDGLPVPYGVRIGSWEPVLARNLFMKSFYVLEAQTKKRIENEK